jgi:hypothetical protein
MAMLVRLTAVRRRALMSLRSVGRTLRMVTRGRMPVLLQSAEKV